VAGESEFGRLLEAGIDVQLVVIDPGLTERLDRMSDDDFSRRDRPRSVDVEAEGRRSTSAGVGQRRATAADVRTAQGWP
jgi:hypothetical protein